MARSKQNKRKTPKAESNIKKFEHKKEKHPGNNASYSQTLNWAKTKFAHVNEDIKKLQNWFSNGKPSNHPDYDKIMRVRTLLNFYTSLLNKQCGEFDRIVRAIERLKEQPPTDETSQKLSNYNMKLDKADASIMNTNAKIEEVKALPFGMASYKELTARNSPIPKLFYRTYVNQAEKLVNTMLRTIQNIQDIANSKEIVLNSDSNINIQTASNSESVPATEGVTSSTVAAEDLSIDMEIKKDPIYDSYVNAIIGEFDDFNIDDDSEDDKDDDKEGDDNDKESDQNVESDDE